MLTDKIIEATVEHRGRWSIDVFFLQRIRGFAPREINRAGGIAAYTLYVAVARIPELVRRSQPVWFEGDEFRRELPAFPRSVRDLRVDVFSAAIKFCVVFTVGEFTRVEL